jgi:AmpD protein
MSELPRITLDRIVGHSDIAPGRKSDPGKGFDWDKIKDRIIK